MEILNENLNHYLDESGGYNSGYSYGSPSCGCSGGYNAYPAYPNYGYGGIGSGAAIILVLFILLVIVIGSRFLNN